MELDQIPKKYIYTETILKQKIYGDQKQILNSFINDCYCDDFRCVFNT